MVSLRVNYISLHENCWRQSLFLRKAVENFNLSRNTLSRYLKAVKSGLDSISKHEMTTTPVYEVPLKES